MKMIPINPCSRSSLGHIVRPNSTAVSFSFAVVVLGRFEGSDLGSERDVHTLVEGTTAMILRNQDGQVAKIDSAAGGSKLLINHVAF